MAGQKTSKHGQVYEHIRSKIARGEYQVGFQIPTEAAISEQFCISRQTVGRALRALELEGLVARRRGAGTFVTRGFQPSAKAGYTVGVLIPDADDGVFFSPMCMQMAFAAKKKGLNLSFADPLHGDDESKARRAEELCQELIKVRVAAVILCPLKLPPQFSDVNTRMARTLEREGIPLVLLDCDICEYPGRSAFDVVGVDNRRGGYVLASHLWHLGCRQIEFVAPYWNRPTVAGRIAGYQEFLVQQGVMADPAWIHRGELSQPEFVAQVIRKSRADAFMCSNDWTAAVLMRGLISHGVRVPDDVRVVGFDDINIVNVLPVPLTTLNQPVEQLGATVVDTMLERLANPRRPARHIMLDCKLVVRESCGAQL